MQTAVSRLRRDDGVSLQAKSNNPFERRRIRVVIGIDNSRKKKTEFIYKHQRNEEYEHKLMVLD